MRYFVGVKTLDELKEQYRKLCKVHHPDLGGDTATMQAINAEYRDILANGISDFGNSSAEIEESIRDIIERAVVFDGLLIELCGRWVWFTGNTFQWKDQLKALGCFYASKKRAWYWRPADEQRSRKGRQLELEQIRERYGSRVFETKSAQALGV